MAHKFETRMSSSMIVIVHVGEPEGVTADYKIDMSAAAKPEPPQEVGQMVEICLIAIRQAAQNIKPGGRFSGISIDLKGMSMPFLVFMEDDSAPSGAFAWLAGLVAPMALAGLLTVALKGVLPEKPPGQAVYTVVSLSMIAMLASIGVALFAKTFLMVPMEIVFALGAAVLICAASILSRSRVFLIFAISATFAVAVVYGIYGAFGWAHELVPTSLSAGAVALLSVLAFTSWGRSGGLLPR